ncbi:hypothetical protein J7J18_02925 [bacterium]|nr:hypothetical protein [bacterium]
MRERIESLKRFQKEKEEGENRLLENLLRKQADNFRESGVPVNERLRIDMEEFKDILPEETVDRHTERLKEVKINQYRGRLSLEKIEEKEEVRGGEKGEIFVTLLLQKFLGDKFLVLRTSPFDDRKSKVDLLVVNKERGEIDFAIDVSVDDSFSPSVGEKQKRLFDRNTHKGTSLTYGIRFEGGKPQPYPHIEYLPAFLLNLPLEILESGINSITSLKEKTPREKKIFNFLKEQIEKQIDSIKEKSWREKRAPHPNLRKKLEEVEKLVKFELSLNSEFSKEI